MSIIRDRHAVLHAPKQDEIVLLQLSTARSLSFPATAKALGSRVNLGIAQEITGGPRNRLFAYDALSQGAEPL
jgi:hypothetical protein